MKIEYKYSEIDIECVKGIATDYKKLTEDYLNEKNFEIRTDETLSDAQRAKRLEQLKDRKSRVLDNSRIINGADAISEVSNATSKVDQMQRVCNTLYATENNKSISILKKQIGVKSKEKDKKYVEASKIVEGITDPSVVECSPVFIYHIPNSNNITITDEATNVDNISKNGYKTVFQYALNNEARKKVRDEKVQVAENPEPIKLTEVKNIEELFNSPELQHHLAELKRTDPARVRSFEKIKEKKLKAIEKVKNIQNSVVDMQDKKTAIWDTLNSLKDIQSSMSPKAYKDITNSLKKQELKLNKEIAKFNKKTNKLEEKSKLSESIEAGKAYHDTKSTLELSGKREQCENGLKVVEAELKEAKTDIERKELEARAGALKESLSKMDNLSARLTAIAKCDVFNSTEKGHSKLALPESEIGTKSNDLTDTLKSQVIPPEKQEMPKEKTVEITKDDLEERA